MNIYSVRPDICGRRSDALSLIRKVCRMWRKSVTYTLNRNRQIITYIDFIIEQPIAKAIQNITNKTIANFLYDDIFINYRSSRELLLNNRTNFLSRIITLYLTRLKTRYRIITLYYLRTNNKIENLNESLDKILTKYLIEKLIRL